MRDVAIAILVTMSRRYKGEQHCCVRAFGETLRSYVTDRWFFRAKFELQRISECPNTNLIKQRIVKYERTGSTQETRPQGRESVIRTGKIIRQVRESLRAN